MTTNKHSQPGFVSSLPTGTVDEINGLVRYLNQTDDAEKLPQIEVQMHLNLDKVLQLTEVIVKLQFATYTGEKLRLTPVGQALAAATIQGRKDIFAQQLSACIPLVSIISDTLQHTHNGAIRKDDLVKHIQPQPDEEEFAQIINWGRYAELFAYDANTETFALPDHQLTTQT